MECEKMKEGEFQKRLLSPRSELFWQRYAYSHQNKEGRFPHQNDYITEVLDEAYKEFPTYGIGDSVDNAPLDAIRRMIEWKKKWFGGEK
jgi:hypothetical protein